MKCSIKHIYGNWRDIADAARTTIGKQSGKGEPKDIWKKQILLAEHSPIRKLNITGLWEDLKSWVSVHFVRHNKGIEHYVRTQRSDRTGVDRNKLTQDSLVCHEFQANIQSIINISRKRLCEKASPETREAWKKFLNEIKKHDENIFNICVPECIYRGHCFEFDSCNYHKTYSYQLRRKEYVEGIN